jgi:hypothetical protein
VTNKKKEPSGVLHSVYFPSQAALDRVKRAAKVSKTKLSVLMRDAINDRVEKILRVKKSAPEAA